MKKYYHIIYSVILCLFSLLGAQAIYAQESSQIESSYIDSAMSCLRSIEDQSPFDEGAYLNTIYKIDKDLKQMGYPSFRDSIVWHGCRVLMQKVGNNCSPLRTLLVTMVGIKCELGQYDLMQQFALYALNLFSEAKDYGIQYVLLSLQSANGYKNMQQYDEMSKCIMLAKDAFNNLPAEEKDNNWIVGVNIDMFNAKYFLKIGDYAQAESLLLSLLKDKRLVKGVGLRRTIINDLSVVYFKEDKKNEALELFDEIRDENEGSLSFLYNYLSLAVAVSDQNRIKSAQQSYNALIKENLSNITSSYKETYTYDAFQALSEKCMMCNNSCANISDDNDVIRESFYTLLFLNQLRLHQYYGDNIGSPQSDPYASVPLKSDQAYILFTFCPNGSSSSQTSLPNFAAYIIRGDSQQIKFINLANVEQIESLFLPESGMSFDALDYSSVYSPNNITSLYRLIWEQITPLIKGCNTIYYTPAGGLSLLNMDVLANESGLNQDYIMVSSISEIGKPLDISDKLSSICLFGNVDYNIDSTPQINSWKPLPGTSTEIESIKSVCSSLSSKVYTGKLATEESIKKLSGSAPSIIHIATHGYEKIYEDSLSDNPFLSKQTMKSPSFITDCSIFSGIVLAGGNLTWNGDTIPESSEDGILTADEIGRLDLSNTELVVLSACETARGYIDPIEGVWGLQRAFKQAGAKTILMTLWKVSDDVTAMFMEQFYKNLMKGKTVRQSVKKAQDYLINNGASDPFYWAPFVVLD